MANLKINEFPKCPNCEKGTMLPVEDYGTNISYLKGWVCSDKNCRNNFFFKAGDLLSLEVKSNKER